VLKNREACRVVLGAVRGKDEAFTWCDHDNLGSRSMTMMVRFPPTNDEKYVWDHVDLLKHGLMKPWTAKFEKNQSNSTELQVIDRTARSQ
jgi:hypothetical protein